MNSADPRLRVIRLASLTRQVDHHIRLVLEGSWWTCQVAPTVGAGEYILIEASRGDRVRKIAFLYTASTTSSVYTSLAPAVDAIVIYGAEVQDIERFSRGIAIPVVIEPDLHDVVMVWNREFESGRWSVDSPQRPDQPKKSSYQILQSELPIEQIWGRLRQLTSVNLARTAIEAGVMLGRSSLMERAYGVSDARQDERVWRGRDHPIGLP